ncbi:ORF67 [Agrotis segetum granulovirus]|uniref:ORF67 n=1 Tax=Agrotis segetum granulosis virus TaxID=10464 RepID=Q6QXQ0_GVAS|nr:hypothetical protein AsGV081 [Agrotis segetum granulovirus]AAS82671.1 ORF67 [Agrotis segetum granulovirus]AHN92120.1 hypothetical protein AsGV081 [Agrotis segetum granulovirus]AKN63355.1 hypothetical protein AsGV081 [Agrotis segetum granulovirus]
MNAIFASPHFVNSVWYKTMKKVISAVFKTILLIALFYIVYTYLEKLFEIEEIENPIDLIACRMEDSTSCRRYYNCFGELVTCPTSQGFDLETRECQPLSEIDCQSRPR